MITPQTNVRLVTCPLTKDQENQIDFRTPTAQRSYFEGLPGLTIGAVNYQRKDNVIRYPDHIDNLWQYNYCMYQNSQFTNKWFYAFIERMEYVNENMTYIYLKTDVYQTWLFNHVMKPCFVEREHVDDDSVGLHTVPENLEYGQYMIKEYIPMDWADVDNSLICMQVTDFPTSANISTTPVRIYNGMPSGCYYIVFPRANAANVSRWINAYVADTKQDAILSIFPIPQWLAQPQVGNSNISPIQNSLTDNTYIFIQSNTPTLLTAYQIPYAVGDDFEGYIPKNNKLYTSPYCYFYLNTFTGSTVEYTYEQFSGPIQFNIYGAITAGGEFRAMPTNIRGADAFGSNAYGISLGSMPQGSWGNDTYLNWKALNSDAIAIEAENDAITSLMGTASNLWDLNIFGALSNEVNYQTRVRQRLNQQRIASKMPQQARGDTATQSLNWCLGYSDGGFYRMQIRREYAMMIDHYFTAFGYQVNEFKSPSYRNRRNFDYIKTVGCNIEGSMPEDDLIELKAIFDHGCTFWHNPVNFLNYDVNNDII